MSEITNQICSSEITSCNSQRFNISKCLEESFNSVMDPVVVYSAEDDFEIYGEFLILLSNVNVIIPCFCSLSL